MNKIPPQHAGLSTEEDIASYLISTPQFFERFAEVLGTVQLANPHGTRAVSLQERQAAMLREQIKKLEASIVEMMGYASENAQLAKKTHDWLCELLQEPDLAELPALLVTSMQRHFAVPQVSLRLWGVDAVYAGLACAVPVTKALQDWTAAQQQPYCGSRKELTGLLDLPAAETSSHDDFRGGSIAVLPLTVRANGGVHLTFGYVLLASEDSERYTHQMGTEFLSRLAELSSAVLLKLLPLTLQRQVQQPLQTSADLQEASVPTSAD